MVVILVLLTAVLISVFFSVKIALERDIRNDLNLAAGGAAEIGLPTGNAVGSGHRRGLKRHDRRLGDCRPGL